jgi:hypothetical protein
LITFLDFLNFCWPNLLTCHLSPINWQHLRQETHFWTKSGSSLIILNYINYLYFLCIHNWLLIGGQWENDCFLMYVSAALCPLLYCPYSDLAFYMLHFTHLNFSATWIAQPEFVLVCLAGYGWELRLFHHHNYKYLFVIYHTLH